MSLASGKPALKAALLAFASNTNDDKDPSVAIDEFINALETYIKTATLNVPGTGLVAPPSGGPVTGSSVSGSLE